MRILAVDTTTPSGSVALLEEKRLLGETNCESPATHSSRLLRSVDFLLRAASCDIRDIDAFAVAVGPGSFTGIRIGVATVKSLARASQKPVMPVSSLLALAEKCVKSEARLICPLLDAKKGEVFGALFEKQKDGLTELIPQGAYAPDTLFSRLPSHRVISFIGSGLDAYGDKLRAYVRDKGRFSARSHFIAAEVGRIGWEMLREGKGVGARDIAPLYFRRSQAEEKCQP